MEYRTIILLSAYRSGASTICDILRKHRSVGHGNSKSEDLFFKYGYWLLASSALEGGAELFKRRIKRAFPFISIPENITESIIFEIWDEILKSNGPIICDKNPSYLGNKKVIDLILQYKNSGRDVVMIGLIRNPLDTITSQYELRCVRTPPKAVYKREKRYLFMYNHLERLSKGTSRVPIFRYEDIVFEPDRYIPEILKHCKLELSNCWQNVGSESVGRYFASISADIKKWKISDEIKVLMKTYGYSVHDISFFKRLILILKFIPDNLGREINITARTWMLQHRKK